MAVYLAPFLATMLLVAAPGAGDDSDNDLTDAEMISTAGGSILGAASACSEISAARLSAAADKVATLVSSAVTDDDELTSAHELFMQSANDGKAAVQSGQADCRTVEASLVKLERLGGRKSE